MSKINTNFDSTGKILIEDGHLLYRNFSGAPSDFNREGDRNFNVIIDDPKAVNEMIEAGWNVKCRAPRDPQDIALNHIKVNVNFGGYEPPKIYIHTGKSMQELTEETVGMLDSADIVSCDMLISPYHYNRNGNSGISAYLKTLHVVLKEDPFAGKYANLEG